MIKKNLFIGSALTAFILIGCGGSSDTTTVASTTGYLVDSSVVNADYDCIADGEYNLTTGTSGAFTCQNMSRVRFRIGNLVLGEIDALPGDGYVLPQDIVGVEREDIYDQRVTEIARLLQSCDSDDNLTNGIQIAEETKTALLEELNISTQFDANTTDTYLQWANRATTRTQTQARAHLQETLTALQTDTTATVQTVPGTIGAGILVDLNSTPLSTLTPETEEAIAYMINEEKLAYDVYMNLYAYHTNSGTEIFQLQNIAQRSESVHMQTVEDLGDKYGLEKASSLPSGTFALPELQTLYDALYAKGTASTQDALEVGCMVEVTDINDLDAKIATAQASNASDVESVFTVLRDGSYNHYWAFDRGLKNLGVADGCCTLGTIDGINYCHSEYPQNSWGNR